MPLLQEYLQKYLADVPPETGIFLLLDIGALFFLLRMFSVKRFYFVRHGETLLNQQHVRQGPEGRLSPKGERQAHTVGASLSGEGIRAIYASPYERALQTANILRAHLNARVHATALLAERRNPSEIIRKSIHDTEVERIVGLTELSYHADDYRYADEENFTDLKKRAGRCIRFLERRWSRDICVVTHHAFLKMLLSYALYREDLHVPHYVTLSFFNPSDNGGITVCEYRPWQRWSGKSRGWTILAYNARTPDAP